MSIIEIPKNLVPENSFLDQIPKAPTGRYAHLIVSRVSNRWYAQHCQGQRWLAKWRSTHPPCNVQEKTEFPRATYRT